MMNKLIKKIFNRETITYLIFGVLTTVVNYAVYYLFYHYTDVDLIVYNTIAWIVAVLFAFVTNKLFVFESKGWKLSILGKEFISFIIARLLSLLIETAFLALTVNLCKMNELTAKLAACVLVVIFNYFASKFFIFKKKESDNE